LGRGARRGCGHGQGGAGGGDCARCERRCTPSAPPSWGRRDGHAARASRLGGLELAGGDYAFGEDRPLAYAADPLDAHGLGSSLRSPLVAGDLSKAIGLGLEFALGHRT